MSRYYKSYAWLQHEPIWTLGEGDPNRKRRQAGATGRCKHHFRLVLTPNAKPEIWRQIKIMCAETNWRPISLGDLEKKTPQLFAKICSPDFIRLSTEQWMAKQTLPIKFRRDSAILEEIEAHVSPEYLGHGDALNPDPVLVSKFEADCFDYFFHFYRHYLICVFSHPDETSMHVGGFVVPAVIRYVHKPGPKKKSGPSPEPERKLVGCSSEIFGGDRYFKGGEVIPGECSKKQDQFVKYLREKEHDIVRGTRQTAIQNVRMRSHVVPAMLPVPKPPEPYLPEPGKAFELASTFWKREMPLLLEDHAKTKETVQFYHEKACEQERTAKHRDEALVNCQNLNENIHILESQVRELHTKLEKALDEVPQSLTCSSLIRSLLPHQWCEELEQTTLHFPIAKLIRRPGNRWKVQGSEKENEYEDTKPSLLFLTDLTGWSTSQCIAWLLINFERDSHEIIKNSRWPRPDIGTFHIETEKSLANGLRYRQEKWLERTCINHNLAWTSLIRLYRSGHLLIKSDEAATTLVFRDLGPLFTVVGDEISLMEPLMPQAPKLIPLSNHMGALVVQDTQELLAAIQLLDVDFHAVGMLVVGFENDFLSSEIKQAMGKSAACCFTALKDCRLSNGIPVELKAIPLRPLKIVDKKVEFQLSDGEQEHYANEAARARSAMRRLTVTKVVKGGIIPKLH